MKIGLVNPVLITLGDDKMSILLNILIYLFAACGAIFIIILLINRIPNRNENDKSKLSLVIMVRNKQDIVEGLVRNFFRGNFLQRVAPDMKITVIDMGSNDETWEILKRLAETYDCLDLIKENEKEKIFTYFQQ